MLRRIAAVLIGLITGSVCITGIEKIGHSLYPPPVGAKDGDMEALKAYVSEAPFMALFFIILAYAVAALVSGFTASKISIDRKPTAALTCGILFY